MRIFLNQSLRMPAAVACLWILLAAFGAKAGGVHFLALGDTGSAADQQRQVAEAMAKFAMVSEAKAPVRFITFLGDNFYDNGVSSVDDPQWNQKLEVMYDIKRLNVPFFAVLGNHDWRSDAPDIEIEYTKVHPQSRWKMFGHYYKQQFWSDPAVTNGAPLLELFAIDTEAWNKASPHIKVYKNKELAAEQLAWLEKVLGESKAVWKVVIAHHPLYSNGEHGHDAQLLNLRKLLGPIFAQYKVDAYIVGHDHDLEHIEIPGHPTLFLITGAGGKLRKKGFEDYQSFYAEKPGFTSIKLTETEMRGEFVDVEGKPLDAWERKPLSATTMKQK